MKQLAKLLFFIFVTVNLNCSAINNSRLFSKETTSLNILINNKNLNSVLLFDIEDVIKDHYVLVGFIIILLVLIIYTKINNSKLFFNQNILRSSQEKQLLETVEKLTYSEMLLNESQRIAKIGNLERNFLTGKTIYSDNVWDIFEIPIDEKDNYQDYFNNLEFIHPDDKQTYFETIEKLKQDKIESYTINYKAITIKGNIINLISKGKRVLNKKGEVEKLLIIIQDVTEKNKIESEVIAYERKFTDIFRYSPLMLSITTLDEGIFIDTNEQLLKNFNLSKEEVIGRSVKTLNLYYDLKDRAQIVELLKEKGHYSNFEAKFVLHDGSIRNGMFNGSIIEINGEKLYLSIVSDITELKNAEAAIKEGEEKYKMIVENTNDGIFIFSKGKLIFTNYKIQESLGYSEEELKNISIFDLIHPEDKQMFKDSIRNRSEGLNDASFFEIRILTKDNLIRICEFTKNVISLNEGTDILGIVHDITDIRTAEIELRIFNKYLEEKIALEIKRSEMNDQALLQKTKLEFIGEMAAGMAHEINQPLTGITMGLDNLLNKASTIGIEETYLTEKVKTLFGYVKRIENIIDHVRTFSRDQQITIFEKYIINETIDNAILLVNKTYKNIGIDITFDFSDSLYSQGNKYKFEQVMLNLLSNAKDAIIEKEKLQKNLTFDKTIEIKLIEVEEMNIICVKDYGIGISKKNIENIFKPFYTTKEANKGTGLGLSIAYGIIKEMNGEIETESIENEYTSMKITLPKVVQ